MVKLSWKSFELRKTSICFSISFTALWFRETGLCFCSWESSDTFLYHSWAEEKSCNHITLTLSFFISMTNRQLFVYPSVRYRDTLAHSIHRRDACDQYAALFLVSLTIKPATKIQNAAYKIYFLPKPWSMLLSLPCLPTPAADTTSPLSSKTPTRHRIHFIIFYLTHCYNCCKNFIVNMQWYIYYLIDVDVVVLTTFVKNVCILTCTK